MVGGGIKKDDGLAAISSTNIFSALEKKRRKSNKKKLSDKDKALGKGKDSKSGDKKEDEPEQFWAPSQVTVKSWADCDDDEDYFTTAAPPPAPWAPDQSDPSEAASAVKDGGLSQGEDSEGDDEGEEEVEDEGEEEQQESDSHALTNDVGKSNLPILSVPREPERQLSKKELKKKELAELDAVLLELGLTPKEENGTPLPVVDETTVADDGVDQVEDGEPRNGPVLTESKSTKRRKAKKEKSFKEGRDGEVPPTPDADGARTVDDSVAEEEEAKANELPADPKEVLKKLASLKKKKSMKESDAAAKAAASEAAARATKLAAAKKKEKNHYNQQPVR